MYLTSLLMHLLIREAEEKKRSHRKAHALRLLPLLIDAV